MIRIVVSSLVAFWLPTGTAVAQTCGSLPYTTSNGQTTDASQVKVKVKVNHVVNCNDNLTPRRGNSAQRTRASLLCTRTMTSALRLAA